MQVSLNGLAPASFVPDGRIKMSVRGAVESQWGYPRFHVTMTDARALQEGQSEADFFEQHGFVLLNHQSAVTDWEPNPASPDESDLARHYLPEIEDIIRTRLLPGRAVKILQRPMLVRRGAGTDLAFYGLGVHQDFGLDAEDYQVNIRSFVGDAGADWWRQQYRSENVTGFMTINFWRTTNMEGPLRHMPLGVCDPSTVQAEDVLPTRFNDIAPGGKPTNQLALRFNPDQRWYYYPEMTGDELLAFKIFECRKEDSEPVFRTCFHSAFEDPTTPSDAEPRQSCEHRVGVFILKD